MKKNKRYSIFSLARNARNYHENWAAAWRSPEPKPSYDAIIVGGGGHGLATAYYLAKQHGITNVALIEKGPIGLGNTGRNTTVIRSNYLWDESAAIYELSLKLYEGLSQELNYNIMLSQRGLVSLAHSQHDLREIERRVNAIRLNGIDSEMLSMAELKQLIPILNLSPNSRYPVIGASIQRRGGTARHDAIAWGYARAADDRGVDILQHTEVTGFRIQGGRVEGVETTRGFIAAPKVGVAVAGHSSVLADMAGFRLPISSHPLQAMVSEPLKPIFNTVLMSAAVHVYLSQSDRGELVMGAGIDKFNSYAQRGSPPILEDILAATVELFPIFSRVKMMRQWGGIVDVCPDASPIVGKTPVSGLYLNCGWGTGGFKSIPGSGFVFAHTIAQDEPHEIAAPFSLERFSTGALIDEHGASGVAH
ncbi:MAG: sarcosine oxidase subunit beta family protein [Rhodospirillaceae bacterium]|jgi:sarcosine oxidase, subunit beta|nr:sarcosine oxidase subunit beta family protein [Rhodospirillaceae bacterium]MBT4425503.1 sarcosine oxidase subunit beta family protein [Rhodospirillaceae bacterium]MBT5037949.1 sarcosine oxidase subunit beta family protein [Rhodospirillaceae bacterium]MBT5675224.1 sarcosine oxidase subunit beta family protein [Rhodospirillaceae bacterium]MBT6829635.1 sarcosine oxidase subunit beta family protein [Rhodospirillaceae bacterium]